MSLNNIELLERLLRQEEKEAFLFILNCCLKLNIQPVTDCKNYIYIEDREAAVCLVSHIDTVRSATDEPVFLKKHNNTLIRNGSGILGADDRVGAYLMLSNLIYGSKKVPVSYLFTTGEEIGCTGAKQFIKDIKDMPKKLQVFIELDRQGIYNYVCYHEPVKEIDEWLTGQGFHEEVGSCSDILHLCEAYQVPGVNIAVGYFQQHTKNEYLYLPYMDEVEKIILPKLLTGPGRRYKIPPTPKLSFNAGSSWFYDKKSYNFHDDADDMPDDLFCFLEELYFYNLLDADYTCKYCGADHTEKRPCKNFKKHLKASGYLEDWYSFFPEEGAING